MRHGVAIAQRLRSAAAEGKGGSSLCLHDLANLAGARRFCPADCSPARPPFAGAQLRTASSTLHSLLDYDEEDDEEPTFELCVFAESVHELLMRDYASTVLHELSGGR